MENEMQAMEDMADALAHHGVKGQKWGVRRYQNLDGTLTEAGRKKLGRYDSKITSYEKKASKYGSKVRFAFTPVGKAINNHNMRKFAKNESKALAYTNAKKKFNDKLSKDREKYKSDYKDTDTVFVSGKVKFDKKLPKNVALEIDKMIAAHANVVIGDAPGADKRVQDFLAKRQYQKVEVYTTDSEARNNVGNWKVNKIDGSKQPTEKLTRAQKDIAMTNKSNKGYAITRSDDDPDSAMSNNLNRMKENGKDVTVYDYKTKKTSISKGNKK